MVCPSLPHHPLKVIDRNSEVALKICLGVAKFFGSDIITYLEEGGDERIEEVCREAQLCQISHSEWKSLYLAQKELEASCTL